MTRTPRQLATVQRWMQSVITHPGGIVAGIDSDEARRQIDVSPQNVTDVILPSRRCDSIERLQVYGNAYFARLVECLRSEFPALVHALDEKTFDAFAVAYLQKHPSQSYTLGDLSRRFPQFLRETRPPLDEVPQPGWPDFLIDLATLERTYSDVFDGPGVEQKTLLGPDDLQAIPPDRWPDARLLFVPCFRLLALSYPVHEYATAVRQEKEPSPPQPQPTWLAITRRAYVVRRTPVSHPQFQLLGALSAGNSVGEAIELVARTGDIDLDALEKGLESWFRYWTAEGYFLRIDL